MVKKYGSNKKYCDNESINYFDIQPNKKQNINQSIEAVVETLKESNIINYSNNFIEIDDISNKIYSKRETEFSHFSSTNHARNLFKDNDCDENESSSSKYDPTYSSDIYSLKRSQEFKYIIQECIFGVDNIQPELDEKMRKILVDWLTEVSEEYKLQSASLHLTVQLLDQTLRIMTIKKNQFQLVGCACLLIAAKIEEVLPPMVENLVYISDFCFDNDALISMESKIVKLLEYNLILPTRYYFGCRFSFLLKMTPNEIELVYFLLELSLLDFSLNSMNLSKVAAAAIHYTIQALRPRNKEVWSKCLIQCCGYVDVDLVTIILKLQQMHWDLEESNQKNILKKYESDKHLNISRILALNVTDLRFDSFEANKLFNNIIFERKKIIQKFTESKNNKNIYNHEINSEK